MYSEQVERLLSSDQLVFGLQNITIVVVACALLRIRLVILTCALVYAIQSNDCVCDFDLCS